MIRKPDPGRADQYSKTDIAPALLQWWDVHGRKDLPWQHNPSPYRVWVSEIMLQQTQVTTVERYYDRFITYFPTVAALADANIDRVLHLWSGLGYYARARNLHRAAGIVRDQFGGELPTGIDALQTLPGIGRSTAGAILALAGDRSFPILDGNVRRVLARVFLIEGWPGSSAASRELWKLSEACTPVETAGNYTQAIMDLGASICTRRNPGCADCPLAVRCAARSMGLVEKIPAPRPKRKRPQREVVFVMVLREGDVLLQRRPDSGVWGGLWCFPETAEVNNVSEWCENKVGISPDRIEIRPKVHHAFTHFDLSMTPVEAHIGRPPGRVSEDGRWLWYDPQTPAEIGLAAPVARLLESLATAQANGELK
jgi:A/G-specific adenine glycosylase